MLQIPAKEYVFNDVFVFQRDVFHYLYILKTKLAAKNGLKIKVLRVSSFAHILHDTHLIPNRVHQFRELRLGSHIEIVKVSPAQLQQYNLTVYRRA